MKSLGKEVVAGASIAGLSADLMFDNTIVEVIGHRTDKHSLRQAGNLAGRDKRVHLRIDRGGNVRQDDMLRVRDQSSGQGCGRNDKLTRGMFDITH